MIATARCHKALRTGCRECDNNCNVIREMTTVGTTQALNISIDASCCEEWLLRLMMSCEQTEYSHKSHFPYSVIKVNFTLFHLTLAQRRNEGVARGRNFPGAESLRGRWKVLTMSQVLCLIAELFQKDLRFEHGGVKLVCCPGRHLTSLQPCFCPYSLFHLL